MTDFPVPGPPSTTKTWRLVRPFISNIWCLIFWKASFCSSIRSNSSLPSSMALTRAISSSAGRIRPFSIKKIMFFFDFRGTTFSINCRSWATSSAKKSFESSRIRRYRKSSSGSGLRRWRLNRYAAEWSRTSCSLMSWLKRRIRPLYLRAWTQGCCLVEPPPIGENTISGTSERPAVSQAFNSTIIPLSVCPSLPASSTSIRKRPAADIWYSIATWMSSSTWALLRAVANLLYSSAQT